MMPSALFGLSLLFIFITVQSLALNANRKIDGAHRTGNCSMDQSQMECQRQRIELLDDAKLNWLNDFVRHGKGSVSRLPFDAIFAEGTAHPTAGRANDNIQEDTIIRISGQLSQAPEKVIRAIGSDSSVYTMSVTEKPASSKSDGTQRDGIDFVQLANLLHQIIEKRKSKNKKTIRSDASLNMDKQPKSENSFAVDDLEPLSFARRVNVARSADRKSIDSARSIADSNARLSISIDQESSLAVSTIKSAGGSIETDESSSTSSIPSMIKLRRLPSRKSPKLVTASPPSNNDPMVYIIREGAMIQNGEDDYEFIATITLVVDGNKKILIDTGLGTDLVGRSWISQRLNELDILPSSIDIVVTTHGHPDHSGNINDYPNAYHYADIFVHHNMHFSSTNLFEDRTAKLTENVYLLKTPGHSSDHISVIVKNAKFFGTMAISGDTFIRKEDLKYPETWMFMSANQTQQSESRRSLICLADHIVPGHGGLFRVTNSMKRRMNCSIVY